MRSQTIRRSAKPVETLERRQFLAAHIGNSPTVYATIQAAVDAAAPGATITVDAGTYPELVSIFKPLTIKGSRAGTDARANSRGSNESIVRGEDFGAGNRSSAFYVAASNVTIDGFTVQDDTSSGVYGAGIVMAPSIAGTRVVNNIIRSNVSGIYLSNNSNASAAVIQRNLIAYNNNPGNSNGRGIYTDGGVSGGLLTNALIDNNTFIGNVGDGTSGNPEAAVGLEAQTAGKQFNITISNNVMQNNGKGVLAYNVVGLSIKNNLITGSKDSLSAALRFEGNVSNATIQSNTVAFGLGAAMRFSNRFVAPNFGFTVTGNNFIANAAGGLFVDPGGYNGPMNARDNYWGSSYGPSGNGPGFGDAVTANGATIDFTSWETTEVDRAPLLNLGARTRSQMIINDLKGLRATLPAGLTRNALDGAIGQLTASVDASLWIDDSRARRPDTVLGLQLDAARRLSNLANSRAIPVAGTNGVIQRIYDVDADVFKTSFFGLFFSWFW